MPLYVLRKQELEYISERCIILNQHGARSFLRVVVKCPQDQVQKKWLILQVFNHIIWRSAIYDGLSDIVRLSIVKGQLAISSNDCHSSPAMKMSPAI